jgi:fibronectin type 3 domain-containing protein
MPNQPTGLTTQAGDSYIEITWNTPSSNGGSAITNYVIYRGLSLGGETYLTEIDVLLVYNDTSVTNGVTYFYKVSAKNVMGEGPLSGSVFDTPQRTPSIPQNLAASAGESFVELSWEVPASDGGASIINYRIYRGTAAGGETFLAEVADITDYNDTTVTNGVTYYYKVTAVNTIGESDLSNEANAIPFEYPGAPQNMTIASGDGYIFITWDTPDSQGSSSVTNYLIFRGTESGTEVYLADNGALLSYNDTSVTNGVTYFYYVIAKNTEGEGPQGVEVSATPQTIPGMSTNLKAQVGDSFVHLTWDEPSSDGGSAITNYRIYRGTTSGDLTLLTELGNLLTYNDTTVTNGVTYYYLITSVNSIGESPQSSEINALPFKDTDSDGTPDHEDTDDDDDGLLDTEELETDPLNPDSDGDTYLDGEDEYPMDSSKWEKDEAKEGFPIWILIILIIVVLVLILLLATRKKGKPKQEPPRTEEQLEFEETKEPELEEGADKEITDEPKEGMEEGAAPEEESAPSDEPLVEEPEPVDEPKETEPGPGDEPDMEETNQEIKEEKEPNVDEQANIDEIPNEQKEIDSPSDKTPPVDDNPNE